MPRRMAVAILALAAGSMAIAPALSQAATQDRSRNYCSDNGSDYWSGVWEFSVDGGEPGRLSLTMSKDGKSVSGRYTGTTNGGIRGELDRACGMEWSGRFYDTSGEFNNTGRFSALQVGSQSTGLTFNGWFKIKGGDRYGWHGRNTYLTNPPLGR